MKVSLIQMNSVSDKAANIAAAEALIAGRDGACARNDQGAP
jgi:predicted amidohydrolase